VKWRELIMKRTKVNLHRAPRIEVKFLWHDDWWDGPLAGMCEHKGQKYFYFCHHENYRKTHKYWRRYGVFKLTPDELVEAEYWHNLFVEKVGDHFDCDEGKRRSSELKPYDMHHEFYDAYKDYERPRYEEKQDRLIGFFDL
jgi:hypothetical protein